MLNSSDIDEGKRKFSLTNRVVSNINARWEWSARLAFDHIAVKRQNYDSEFVDHNFEQMQLCFAASKALCTLYDIQFLLPELEASEFRKQALEGNRAYLFKCKG